MEQRKKLKGIIPRSDFQHIAHVLFPKAFQVYIGCGAEPTTHRNFIELIQLAKKYNVPDIGVVTNGQLLTEKQIEFMCQSGLNELTLSCHGIYKDSYEHFMTNSKFDRFKQILEQINTAKKRNNTNLPEIRINYTVNNKNLRELNDFFSLFDAYNISTLQIRPVLNIGGKYSNAITDEQVPEYNRLIGELKRKCSDRFIRLLANTANIKFTKKNHNEKVANAVYCYIGPKTDSDLDINWSNVSYKEFVKKSNWRKKINALLFSNKKSSLNISSANYEVFE